MCLDEPMKCKTASERDLSLNFYPFGTTSKQEQKYLVRFVSPSNQLIFRGVRRRASTILFSRIIILCICRSQLLLLPVPWYSQLVSATMPSFRSDVKNIALLWHAALRRHVCFQVVTSRFFVRFRGLVIAYSTHGLLFAKELVCHPFGLNLL